MPGPTLEVKGYAELQRALKRYDKEAQKALQKAIRVEITKAATIAKGNAAWSQKIPRSIGVSVTARGAGVKTRRKVAPHGALFERGPFRHPLFGNRDHWFVEPARPFIQPAVVAVMPLIRPKLDRLLEDASRKVGLSG